LLNIVALSHSEEENKEIMEKSLKKKGIIERREKGNKAEGKVNGREIGGSEKVEEGKKTENGKERKKRKQRRDIE
jgi:hypothetical protein